MMNRDIDGVYFRIERDGEFQNLCFSDLTTEERRKVMEGRSNEWLKSLCEYLGSLIREIGDKFGLVGPTYSGDDGKGVNE